MFRVLPWLYKINAEYILLLQYNNKLKKCNYEMFKPFDSSVVIKKKLQIFIVCLFNIFSSFIIHHLSGYAYDISKKKSIFWRP